MTTKVTAGAEPRMNITNAEFRNQTDDGTFWGIPTDYFKHTPNGIKIKSELASQLDWIIWSETSGVAEISATTQPVTLDGKVYGINPGFAPCVVSTDLLLQ